MQHAVEASRDGAGPASATRSSDDPGAKQSVAWDRFRLGADPSAHLASIPWRAQLVSLSLMVSDFAGVFAAYLVSSYLYTSTVFEFLRRRQDFAPTDALILGLVMGVVLIFLFAALGLYRCGVSILNVEEDASLLRGLAFHSLIVLSLAFVIRDYVPRTVAMIAVGCTGLMIFAGRRWVRAVSDRLLAAGVGSQPAVIYGAGDTGRQVAHRLFANQHFGLVPVGFLDDNPQTETGAEGEIRFGPGRKWGLKLLGRGADFPAALREHGARVLLLAMPHLDTERLEDIQERCSEIGVACYRVPLCPGSHLRRFSLTFVGDIPLVAERTPSLGLTQRVAKRLFDAAVSAALLLVLSPLLLLIACLIRVCSPGGPAIFRQERIGHLGRPFDMYKFRSMHPDAPAYARKPENGDDPRIFKLGRLLRKTSLDELPQLWNVLKGDMSLVGPRPEMPHIVAGYNALHRERLLVKPGMTGLWQVSGDRNLPIDEGLDYDLYYLYNQSFVLDLAILARTPFVVCGGM